MTYRHTKLLLHVLILAYVGVALHVGFIRHHREVFPFASWSLFSYVAAEKTEFAVLITHVDGEPLDAPREFMDSRDLVSGAGNIRAYYTIQDLGHAIRFRNTGGMDKLRRLLETEYMKGPSKSLGYQLILRSFDAIERWRGGPYQFRMIANLELREGGS